MQGANYSILWVDNEPDKYDRTADLLRELLPANVRLASTYGEATAKLRAHNFDIVILDLMLPGSDGEPVYGGLAILEYVEKQKNLNAVEPDILVLTGANRFERVLEKIDSKCRIITKPFSVPSLLDTCQKILLQRK